MASGFNISKSAYPFIQILLRLMFLGQNVLLHIVGECRRVFLFFLDLFLGRVVFLEFIDDAVFYVFTIILGEVILVKFLVWVIPIVKVLRIILLIASFAVLVEALLQLDVSEEFKLDLSFETVF